MNLVNDINLMASSLWWNSDLFIEIANIFYRVVRSRIEFKNIKGKVLVGVLNALIVDFFRIPLGPQNKSACGSCSLVIAFSKVCVIAC